MRYLFLLCFLPLLGCSADDGLVLVCPDTCYTGEERDIGIGVCRAGVPTCDDDGNVLSCEGEVLPEDEVCDGRDNNCDGRVDDLPEYRHYHSKNDCKQEGICSGTPLKCVSGEWTCMYPPDVGEEICDALDNDCNGIVDDLPEADQHEFCYTGPEGTALTGACSPGYWSCNSLGEMVCDDIVPRDEICNGLDDDCDGFVDNIVNTYQSADIVFGIDLSGSMSNIHTVVREAICQYAEATENSDANSYHFGLVGIAHPDDHWHLAQDIASAAELCATMMDLPNGGGHEPSISAALAVTDPANPLGISWRRNSKRIYIGFADEDAQSRRETCVFDLDVCIESETLQTAEYCQETGTDVYWFITEPAYYDIQASSCNGDYFWLHPNIEYIIESLNGILEEICLEDEAPPLPSAP